MAQAGALLAVNGCPKEGVGSWVRPVSARPTLEVSEEDRQYEDGTDPNVLDIIAVPMVGPQPLRAGGIRYAFLGRELGARTEDRSCYVGGKVQYDLLARTPLFQSGLDRIAHGRGKYRIALLCAERDPLTCHRAILVSRHLAARGIPIWHISDSGKLESHDDSLSPHRPELAPTQEILDAYKKGGGAWADYEKRFLALMAVRHIENIVPRDVMDGACLLCSEDKPHHCHRRLVASPRWRGRRAEVDLSF
jgi:uncharacterized protein (DUF488 family)